VRLPVCSFLVLIVSVAWGQQSETIRRNLLDATSSTVLVAAHRGAHKVYPENSIKAIQEAIRLGVDIAEIDVKVSKDGIPFLMHDCTLDRTTTGKGDPERLTWAELQQLFIVDKGRRTSLKIPSLEEALSAAGNRIMVDLDLKTDRIEEVLKVVRKSDATGLVIFFDSNYKLLSRIQRADNNYMIMPRAHSVEQADSLIGVFDPPVVHIDFSFYTDECVQLIQSSFARVWINALGELDEAIAKGKERYALKKLLEHGANVIQTDEPALLLKALREQGLHP
jgi:glycerophosphoryl diester phosphodiesterase